MFLAENLKILLSASIAFDRSNANRTKPNPYTSKKRESKSVCSRNVLSFSVSDVFAIVEMMLFAQLIVMLRAYARSDVMLAHCAAGTTSFTQ